VPIIIIGCGGGGGSSGGSGSSFPIGYCIESSNKAIASPSIISGATTESSIFSYANDGSLQSNSVLITYIEMSLQPSYNIVDYAFTKANYPTTLPSGYCAMSPSTVANTYLPNTSMYFNNCQASVANGILSFNSNYSIYTNGTQPGTGNPTQSGMFNFTCSFKSY
jgi:hypothetical protein